MTIATKLLTLIEQADPADEAGLDEIDARVDCYEEDVEFMFMLDGGGYVAHREKLDCKRFGYARRYTRDRNALKAIRPEGWSFKINEHLNYEAGKLYKNSWEVTSYKVDEKENTVDLKHGEEEWWCIFSKDLPTEELAELHAIIQAIEWTRRNKGKDTP